MAAENKPQKLPIQATDTGQIYLTGFGPENNTNVDQFVETALALPAMKKNQPSVRLSLRDVATEDLLGALEKYPEEDLKLEQTGRHTLIRQDFSIGGQSLNGSYSRLQLQEEVNRRNNLEDITKQVSFEGSRIDGYTDESVIDGFKFFYSLYRGRTRRKIDTKRKIKFNTEDGSTTVLEISLPELRRLWFDRLVSRGNEIFDKQQLLPDRTEEKQSLTEKLRSTVLDLECLDHMSIDQIWSSGKGNYEAFKAVIANRYKRDREVLDQARESRESFFGKNNVPVWMEDSIIACRVRKTI